MIQPENAVVSITKNGHIYFGKKMVVNYRLQNKDRIFLIYGQDHSSNSKNMGIYCSFFPPDINFVGNGYSFMNMGSGKFIKPVKFLKKLDLIPTETRRVKFKTHKVYLGSVFLDYNLTIFLYV